MAKLHGRKKDVLKYNFNIYKVPTLGKVLHAKINKTQSLLSKCFEMGKDRERERGVNAN